MAQTQKLQPLSEMDAAVRQKVIEVYSCFTPDFRERMDIKIVGLDWCAISSINLCISVYMKSQ